MGNAEHVKLLKQGTSVWNMWRTENPEIKPDLANENLMGEDLSGANLWEANLIGATLNRVDFSGANLSGANISRANLIGTNLCGANLSEALLSGSVLSRSMVDEANFSNAKIGYTIIGDIDLSNVTGLESTEHFGPSTIGIDTIFRSGGKIPRKFLADAGVPDNLVKYMGSQAGQAFQYYSCL